MRLAPLALVAACSSPAPAVHPVDDVHVPIDAAPVARVAPPDAAGPCFHGADLDRYADGALVLCDWDIVGDDVRACVAVSASGAWTEVTESPRLPEAQDDGTAIAGQPYVRDVAKICLTPETCTTLRPKRAKGQEVEAAAVDATGARAALALGGDDTVTISLELWDVAKAKLIAHVDLPRQGARMAHDVSFLGDTVLLELHDVDLNATVGSLWQLDGKKLTSVVSLPGAILGAGMASAGHAAFALDDDIVIYDLATGRALGSSPWVDLLDDAGRARRASDGAVYVWLAGDDDVVGALVTTLDLQTMAAGVVSPLGGAPQQRFSIPICPIEVSPEEIRER